jgi:hypothetical protein
MPDRRRWNINLRCMTHRVIVLASAERRRSLGYTLALIPEGAAHMTTFHGRIRRRAIIRQLARVFDDAEAASGRSLPIQKTGRGIWAATPVRVVAEAALALSELGLLDGQHQAGHVIDAGTGDGRVPAVLAALHPTLVVHGIEADQALHSRAVANIHTLTTSGLVDSTHVHLLGDDYCDVATYQTRGIALHKVGLILNYPDGNERQLARFVVEHCGADTTLCLLTHNRTLEIDELELRSRHDVSDGTGPPWRLSVYRRPSSGTIGC